MAGSAGRPSRRFQTMRRMPSTAIRRVVRGGLPGESMPTSGFTIRCGSCRSRQFSAPERYSSTVQGNRSPPKNSMQLSGETSLGPDPEGSVPTAGSASSQRTGLAGSKTGLPLSLGAAAAACHSVSCPPVTRLPSAKPAEYKSGSAAAVQPGAATAIAAACTASRRARWRAGIGGKSRY